MKSIASIVAAPALCLMVLGAIALEKRSHVKPEDTAPYHARAKALIDSWPAVIADPDPKRQEVWRGEDWKVPEAAVQLLRPNTILSRRYTSSTNKKKWVDLLVVQCRDPGDMSGHYPPNCYPNSGEEMAYQHARTWEVAGQTVRGMEYHFESGNLGLSQRCVYNFFVLPGRGIVPDMQEVRDATGDYQRRHFGAAQFQVVFPPDNDAPYDEITPEARDEIFRLILGANPDVFRVLDPSGI